MRLFFDTEFTGLHKNTTLISLGIIAENNKCFYAIFTDYDTKQVDGWIEEHVLSNLKLPKKLTKKFDITEVTGTKVEVKEALLKWLDSLNSDYFEMVSDVCHYDMVLFIDIFGTAFDLPKSICPACWDINQDLCYSDDIRLAEVFDLNREDLLKRMTEQSYDEVYYGMQYILSMNEECKHNALWDAIVIKGIYSLM